VDWYFKKRNGRAIHLLFLSFTFSFLKFYFQFYSPLKKGRTPKARFRPWSAKLTPAKQARTTVFNARFRPWSANLPPASQARATGLK